MGAVSRKLGFEWQQIMDEGLTFVQKIEWTVQKNHTKFSRRRVYRELKLDSVVEITVYSFWIWEHPN